MSPAQYDEVLASLYRIQGKFARRMLVNAKCAPHYIKTVLENAGAGTEPTSTNVPRRQGSGGLVESAKAPSDPAQGWGSPTPPGTERTAEVPASEPGLSQIRVYSGGAGGCPAGTHYMGIRPNGDVTPCPYLPVFAGTLRSSSLADLWTSSELFTGIRRRASLEGRCGACEMNAHCGGCRARAYGMTGDLMAEDPLCTHTPGTFAGSPLLLARRSLGEGGTLQDSPPPVGGLGAALGTRAIEYGLDSPTTIAWDDVAAARMKRIPAFVRGMVVRAVEESCRRNGISRVTVEELERIRARMPTPKLFGEAPPVPRDPSSC
jgi:radical SAM protein with 4Fe4S-binding SPASM domain